MATLEEVLRRKQEQAAEALRELPPIIGNEAVNFSLETFEKQAWPGNSTENWDKRKNPTKWGKADDEHPLLQKTMKMKRSIRVTRIEEDRVWIGAGGPDIPYARVHNEGSKGYVTQKVKPYSYLRNGKKVEIKAGFERTINQNIPKRQYIGGEKDSPFLKARVRRVAIAHFRNKLKQ